MSSFKLPSHLPRAESAQVYPLRIMNQRFEIFKGRRATPKFHGLEATPGGRLDPGETAIEAAVRELKEEAGGQISHTQLYEVAQFEAHSHCRLKVESITAYILDATNIALWNASPDEHYFMGWQPIDLALRQHHGPRPMVMTALHTLEKINGLKAGTFQQVVRYLPAQLEWAA